MLFSVQHGTVLCFQLSGCSPPPKFWDVTLLCFQLSSYYSPPPKFWDVTLLCFQLSSYYSPSPKFWDVTLLCALLSLSSSSSSLWCQFHSKTIKCSDCLESSFDCNQRVCAGQNKDTGEYDLQLLGVLVAKKNPHTNKENRNHTHHQTKIEKKEGKVREREKNRNKKFLMRQSVPATSDLSRSLRGVRPRDSFIHLLRRITVAISLCPNAHRNIDWRLAVIWVWSRSLPAA